jgi:hypothetical protein
VKRRLLACMLGLALILTPSQSVYSQDSGWEVVADGIEYKEFRLSGPNRAFVARMDRSNENVILETSIAQGIIPQGKETVRNMADRYDQALNAWGGSWGSRNHVVVAINGSFYIPETGFPQEGLIHSGWFAYPFGNKAGGSGFAWKQDRTAFIGECVYYPPEKQLVTNFFTGAKLSISGINTPFEEDLTIYTPQFARESHREGNEVEALVQLTRPLRILQSPDMTWGIIREIDEGEGSNPIPFDHVVLSGNGGARKTILQDFHEGDVVAFSLDVEHFEHNCSTPLDPDWYETYASIGGSYIFLKDGIVQTFEKYGANMRNPRTAICFNDDYIFFLVVDGRKNSYSVGMSMGELGTFCKDNLGADWGLNQDGGGSSTMWINGQVMNSPSDGEERPVANGMMMVIVEPMEQSTAFESDDRIRALNDTNLYLGPGAHYGAVASVAKNSHGVILPQINDLNGVLAKGSYWWQVDFGGAVGWVDESALTLSETP